MYLDIFTIQAMDIAVTAVLSAMLVFTWTRERDQLVGLWGLAMGLQSLGIVAAAASSSSRNAALAIAGTSIMLVAEGLKWQAMRQFSYRFTDHFWLAISVGPIVYFIVCASGALPEDDWLILFSAMVAFYDFAAAMALARAEGEHLTSHWLAIVLLAITGLGQLSWVPLLLTLPMTATDGALHSSWFPLEEFLTLLIRIGLAFVILAIAKERREWEQRVNALTDGLTGLPNRRALYQAIEAAEKNPVLNDGPLSVLFFDLDHFKHVNDKFGHEMGDRVLRLFAETMSSCLDYGNCIIARMGGEEFIAVLPGADCEEAMEAAEKVRSSFAQSRAAINGMSVGCTVSVGVASAANMIHDESDFDALYRRSDAALYVAKNAGRNRVEYAGGKHEEAPKGAKSIVRSSPRRKRAGVDKRPAALHA